MGTNLDALVIENFIIKKDQKSARSNDYRDNYELD